MENWEKINLYGAQSTSEAYLLRSTTPNPGKLPVMLVAPGGGYRCVCHAFSNPEEFAAELDKMEVWLEAAGVPPCVSFAYPGGNFVDYVPEILKSRKFRCARAAEPTMAAWTRETDPMHIPCQPLQHGDDGAFFKALECGKNGDPVVLLYHGVPDRVHAHVSTDFADFARQMKYLYENGYEVITMKEALRRLEENGE